MISIGIEQKMPKAAMWYMLVTQCALGILFIALGILLLSLGQIEGTETVNGIDQPVSFSTIMPGIVLLIVGIFSPVWSILSYILFTFSITDRNVTINSGILFRKHETIDFSKIQSLELTRGPIQMLFGITSVNIWTASPNQVSISTRMIRGNEQSQVTATPDGRIYLLRQDAEDARNFVSEKMSVQKVNVVSQGV